ncbi:MAG: outer membrane protein [Phyllobacterium sp.]
MKFTAFAAAMLLSPTVAYAADAVVYEPAPIASPATFSWTGFYLGANAGYGGGEFDHPFSIRPVDPSITDRISGSLDVDASGFLGGVQAGYNWQFENKFVVGLEADIQASGIEGDLGLSVSVPGGGSLSGKAGTEVEWFGTVRARIGYTPVERLLVYATGGLAYGKVESFVKGSVAGLGSFDESVSETRTGWTAGAGIEYAVADNWTLKTEYLYTDLGKMTAFNDYLDPTASVLGKIESDVSFHTVRVGLNYKF